MVHWIWIPACLCIGAFLTFFALALCRAGRDN